MRGDAISTRLHASPTRTPLLAPKLIPVAPPHKRPFGHCTPDEAGSILWLFVVCLFAELANGPCRKFAISSVSSPDRLSSPIPAVTASVANRSDSFDHGQTNGARHLQCHVQRREYCQLFLASQSVPLDASRRPLLGGAWPFALALQAPSATWPVMCWLEATSRL